MTVKDFYENMYGDQAKRKSKLPFFYRTLRRFEINRYNLAYQLAPGGNSVLDIGCGDGELLVLLKGKYREVWGVDIAQPRIDRILRASGSESGIHVKTKDVNEKLDFEDGCFDAITAISIFEHIFDPYHLIKECQRLLSNGGTLIVQVPSVAWLPNRLRLLMGRLPVTAADAPGWDGGHLHYFTRASLKKLFLEHGFDRVKVTNGGIFAGIRRIWGSLLGADIFIVGRKTPPK
jgi:SAM-dependent methyltransferase